MKNLTYRRDSAENTGGKTKGVENHDESRSHKLPFL